MNLSFKEICKFTFNIQWHTWINHLAPHQNKILIESLSMRLVRDFNSSLWLRVPSFDSHHFFYWNFFKDHGLVSNLRLPECRIQLNQSHYSFNTFMKSLQNLDITSNLMQLYPTIKSLRFDVRTNSDSVSLKKQQQTYVFLQLDIWLKLF